MGQFHYGTPTSTNQLMRKKLIHAGKVFRKRDAKKTYADCRRPEAAPFMIESEALNYLHHDFVQSEKTFHFFSQIYFVSTPILVHKINQLLTRWKSNPSRATPTV